LPNKNSVLTGILGFDAYYLLGVDSLFELKGLYHSFEINPRRNNRKRRTITAPCEALKMIQRAIYAKILVHVAPHSAATAYYYGRSIALNANQHLGCKFLYKTDVSNFFPSITSNLIETMLERQFAHLSQSAIAEIVQLTTYDGALPQGAPTSPHLANLVLYQFDDQLSKLCERIGATYTRYADDISVSAQDMDVLLIVDGVVRSSLAELGLLRHPNKTRFFGSGVRKIVTGLDVSGGSVRPPRRYRKRTAALIRICETYPRWVKESNWTRIMGYLQHWQGVAPNDFELIELKRRLKKTDPRRLQVDDTLNQRFSQRDSDGDSETPSINLGIF